MPNRILREGILTSLPVNSLSMGAELFYRRLMSAVDDFGRFDGNHDIIRARLYPLQLARVSDQAIAEWVRECVNAKLVEAYSVEDKPYLLFLKLGEPRAKRSRYPSPRADEGECRHKRPPYALRLTDSPIVSCSEPSKTPASEPAAVLTFPVVGNQGAEWGLAESKVAEYRATFPSLDVLAEARKARQWLADNPSRRKTPRGMTSFLFRWLEREQNKPGQRPEVEPPKVNLVPGARIIDPLNPPNWTYPPRFTLPAQKPEPEPLNAEERAALVKQLYGPSGRPDGAEGG
jgi:hypothetical protein